jgi:hypothetical protein
LHTQQIRFKDEKSYVYLRFNCISTSPKLLELVDKLAERCRRSRSTVRQVYKDFKPAFNAVLTSLEVSGAYKESQWIRIVTDDEVYGGKTQRSAAHNRLVLTALLWLIDEAYLLKVDGRRVMTSEGSSQVNDLPFAYVISDKWRSEIADQPISHQHEIVRNPLASYVQLRHKIKISQKVKERSISLPITQVTRERYPDLIEATERLLKVADDVWAKSQISLGDVTLPAMQTTMTRIFNNGSFEEGGRFYCQLQNLPKSQRKEILFDKEPTLEIDYSGMHPHLLYHLQGDNFSGDPYEVVGFDRNTVKVAFNTLINRDSRKHKGAAAKSLARNLNMSLEEAKALENALYKLHPRITGYFNTGYGLRLQKLDSQIAYEVMMIFFMRIKRPVLMIHDSAIVSVRDVETLKLSMVDAYRSATRNELQSRGNLNGEQVPLPMGLKVSSADFNDKLTSTIFKALEEIDVHPDEWTTAINFTHHP